MSLMRYQAIYADPPWPERGAGKCKRGADRHYHLLTVEGIAALSVWKLAAAHSHCYLWVTNNYLPAGVRVLAAWGFRYVTCITWAKDKIGLGQYFRGQTEQCLFGARGSLPYAKDENGKRLQGTTLLTAPRQRHSAKPEAMYELIERVSPAPRLELFARGKREGWDVWGKEVDGIAIEL